MTGLITSETLKGKDIPETRSYNVPERACNCLQKVERVSESSPEETGHESANFHLFEDNEPGNLVVASTEKLTNPKHSNTQLCSDMFHNGFVISVCNLFISLVESHIRKR